MGISNANLPAVVLLCEIDLQCKVILRAAAWLREASVHWHKLARGVDDGTAFPPIEIVGRCSVIVSAAASVSRMLFVGKREGAKAKRLARRCEVLMVLLGNPQLDSIRWLEVRNSWEHLDERLDEVLVARSYKSYSEVHVSPQPPSADTFVNRHFDPTRFVIRHGPDAVALNPIIQECELLVDRVARALNTLSTGLHNPYRESASTA